MAHTAETMDKSTKSYMRAFRKLAKAFGPLRLDGSGYSNQMGERFCANSVDTALAAMKANLCFAQHEGLFEYGRPKLVREDWWISQTSFFKLRLYRDEPWQIHHTSGGVDRTDDHGIRCVILDRGYGLKAWAKNREEILDIARQCSDADVKKKILEQTSSADDEIKRWEEAIRSLTSVVDRVRE